MLLAMDTTHQPPAGDPQDSWPTQELAPATGQPGQGPGWSQPSGHAGPPGPNWNQPSSDADPPGPNWNQPSGHADPGWGQPTDPPPSGWSGPPGYPPPGWPGPSGPSGPPRRHSRAAWWGAGLALAAVLAGGGAIAASHLASSGSPLPSGPTGQAAVLNTMLNSAASPASAAADTASAGTAATPCLNRAAKLKADGFPGLAQAVLRRCGHPLRRLRVLGGIHGVFTFETKSGPQTLAYERGVIESVSGSNVEVQATDGTLWTWVVQSDTVIRHSGEKVTASALSDGQQVFAGGPVVGGAYDARLIVIRPASPSPSASPAAGS
jgi:hypothetical protein